MKTFKIGVCALAVIGCGMFSSSTVQAQTSPLVIENVPNIVGLGVGIAPDYQGSDDTTGGGAPFAKISFSTERYLLLLGPALYANLLDHKVFRFGPVLNYRFGRDDDVDDEVVKKMTEIDGTFEAGLFGGMEFVNPHNPRQRFITSLEFLQDVGNEHDGFIANLSGRFWYPMTKAIDVTLGAAVSYADDDYMETYFGVDSIDSGRSALPVFNAGSGVKGVTIVPGAVMHLSESWHVGLGLRYEHLLGDAEDSPVVETRGDANQFVAGLAVAYSW